MASIFTGNERLSGREIRYVLEYLFTKGLLAVIEGASFTYVSMHDRTLWAWYSCFCDFGERFLAT